jgi:hypothetical protein
MARITETFVTLNEDMLQNTGREINYRFDVLRVKREHML